MNPAVRSDRDQPAPAAERVAKNTAYLGLAEVANKLMVFFFYLLAARHLGVEKFGVLSFALAFVTMLAVLTDLGLGAITAREIARDRSVARRFVSNAITIKAVASMLVMALIVGSVRLLGYPLSTVRVVSICSLFVVESAFAQYFGFVFQGFERMEFTALSRVLQTATLIAGAVLLSRGSASAERYALVYAGAGLVSVAFAWSVSSIGFVKPGFAFDLSEWRVMLRAALPVGIASAFVVFYYWNGSTLLSKLQGDVAVGNYNAAFRLVTGMTFAGFAFSGAVFPFLSRLHLRTPERLPKALEVSMRYMTIVALPLGVLGTALASSIITALYGNAYHGAVPVFRVLVLWGGCACLNAVLSNYFISVDRARTFTVQAGLALGVNLVLNVALIPILGAVGAALSIAAAEAASLGFYFIRLRQAPGRMRAKPVLSTALRGFVSAAAGAVVASIVVRRNPIAGLVTGPLLYFVLLSVTRGIGKGDWYFFRNLLRSTDA
jgi:O-antigen/teichoic acid export membrane protein